MKLSTWNVFNLPKITAEAFYCYGPAELTEIWIHLGTWETDGGKKDTDVAASIDS